MADKDGEEKKADEGGGGGKKKLLLIVGPVLLVVILAAVYFLVLKPAAAPAAATAGAAGAAGAGGGAAAAAPAAAPAPTTSYVPGAVVKTDPVSINLAGGHYLKLSMALQASATAGEEVSPAKALDAAIELFSNKSIAELSTREGRDKAKEKLVDHVAELYEYKVYDIYFTEFVMQ